jgi:putative phosphoribosyl transferase
MFTNRRDAGRRLGQALHRFRGPETVVLGLPRGGVPVAAEVAAGLGAPLDVIVVRKLGVPYQPELAMGAVGEGGVTVLGHEVLDHLHVSEVELAAVADRERAVVRERAHRFRPGREALSLEGRIAVVVDDGIATGATARAACAVARAAGAATVVLAVPVAPQGCGAEHWPEVDDFVCLERPAWFHAVGQFYDDFSQTTDDEVAALLRLAAATAPAVPETPEGDGRPTPPGDTVRHLAPEHPTDDREVRVPVGDVDLAGHLTVPAGARGVVLFAHGSGSSRHSPRNRYVASVLQDSGLGTLLFDLLTPEEEAHRGNVFDIDLLARRLVDATAWLHAQPSAQHLPVAYFGASTGAAAALAAAAERPDRVAAVVSRGGRPDLAGAALEQVQAPTLLVVGSRDDMVLELNRRAQRRLRCESRLSVVQGATHLFEEPGTLAQAARLARDWFLTHLAATGIMSG